MKGHQLAIECESINKTIKELHACQITAIVNKLEILIEQKKNQVKYNVT